MNAKLEWAKHEHPVTVDFGDGPELVKIVRNYQNDTLGVLWYGTEYAVCAHEVTPITDAPAVIPQAAGGFTPGHHPSDAYVNALHGDTGPTCTHCDDTGWVTVYDSVDYGSTTVSMPSDEPCEFCERGAQAARGEVA